MSSTSAELLDNAIDFIDRAVIELKSNISNREHDNKYAALYLASGIEILLKARLAAEHWTLIFDDPGSARLTNLETGKFASVSASRAIDRLKAVLGLEINKKQPDKVFELRNRLVHFMPLRTGDASRVTLAEGLSFTMSFMQENVREIVSDGKLDLVDEAIDRVRTAFLELQDLADKRMLLLSPELATKPVILECPICTKFALLPGNDSNPKCLFCYFTEVPPLAAETYAYEVLHIGPYEIVRDGANDPITHCPECGESSLVAGALAANRPNINYVCLSCATTYEEGEFTHCSRCGSLMFTPEDNVEVCSDCFSDMVSGD